MRSVEKKKTVVVLGMARSGTSGVAGILKILGVDMGRTRAPDETNPQGYFEDIEASLIIHEIFSLAGGSWRKPPSYKKVWSQEKKIDYKIKQYVNSKKKQKDIWGWKVPGTSLTIELFLPYLIKPHFVVVFRNPLNTAGSLVSRAKKRDKGNITLEESLRLTHLYNVETLDFLKRHPDLPKLFVSFEAVLKDPIKETEKLADFLDLNLTEEKKRSVGSLIVPRDVQKVKGGQVTTGEVSRFSKVINRKAVQLLRTILALYNYVLYYLYYRIYLPAIRKSNF